jgi:hypothetical protein
MKLMRIINFFFTRYEIFMNDIFLYLFLRDKQFFLEFQYLRYLPFSKIFSLFMYIKMFELRVQCNVRKDLQSELHKK